MKHIFSIIIICLIAGCYSKTPVDKTGLEGKPIPSFKILLTDSATYLDTKDIPDGKRIVLFYYGTHCPYSKAQMEEMIENMSILQKYQFLIVTRGSHKQMKDFYSKFKLNQYKNIIAGLDQNNVIANTYKVMGVPFTAIFDERKKLVSAFTGLIYTKQIINAFNQ